MSVQQISYSEWFHCINFFKNTLFRKGQESQEGLEVNTDDNLLSRNINTCTITKKKKKKKHY